MKQPAHFQLEYVRSAWLCGKKWVKR